MARSTLLVSANGLRDILPFVAASARIVSTQRPKGTDLVALIIEGEAIPDAPAVTCTVSKKVKLGKVTLTMAYEAAD